MMFEGKQLDACLRDDAFEFEISLVLCFLVTYLLYRVSGKARRINFPPGPTGLPIVGHFPFLSGESFRNFIELGKKYGDVFSVQLGSKRVVVLHGSEAIREALFKPEFLGRPPLTSLGIVNEGSPFFSSNMGKWYEHRRFTAKALKDLGTATKKFEGEVHDEVGRFLDVLSGSKGTPLDVNRPLLPSMSNNISALLLGRRMEFEHPDREMLDNSMNEAHPYMSETNKLIYFDWLRYIPFAVKFFQINKSMQAYKKMKTFFGQVIEQHKSTFEPNNIRDFIDTYFLEMRARQEKNPDTTFSESTLLSNVTDMFEAGTETVKDTILWAVYDMAAFPEVQKRVREEILEIVGTERKPEVADLKELPYTYAVIMEIMRWKSIMPLNPLRYTLEDTSVGGYDIPKHTIVIANFWNAQHDERYWDEPDAFQPERFLSPDGKKVVKNEHFFPFSLGKRECQKNYAKNYGFMLIFLYFASMLQKFEIVFPEGIQPEFKAKACLNYRKDPYTVRFIQKV